jgi:NADPH:quinone reductase-like Zn-dependent oxidoreductase
VFHCSQKYYTGIKTTNLYNVYWIDAELTDEKYIAPLGGAAADGVLAEYVKFSQEAVVKVPDNLSDEEAATLPVAALTAWHAVALRSKIQSNDTVVIQGTGGVSLFALQFVTSLGGLPILTSSSDEKLSQLAPLGAFATISYTTFPDWEQKVLELTNGKGANHIIEVVGGENLNRSLVAVKLSGTISFIGLIAGLHGSINTYQFVNKNVNIHGIETGSRAMFEEMNRFIDQHRIKPIISAKFEIADIHRALKMLERGSHLGKIAITLPH